MIRCLIRAMRAGRMMHPEQAETWIFAADGREGLLIEHKERRTRLFKWGNDLRQTYRTLGQAVGLSDVDMHLLMNHSLPGVNAGYITRVDIAHREASHTSSLTVDFVALSNPKRTSRLFLSCRRLGTDLRPPICTLFHAMTRNASAQRPRASQTTIVLLLFFNSALFEAQ